jgi:Polyketide cyclase / dehydrase and lipid transport
MTTYNVLNEATIAATPAEITDALTAEAAGRSRWWQPLLALRQRGDQPITEIGAVLDITVNGAGQRWGSIHFSARVTAYDPGRQLILTYFAGDFRGREEWLLDAVDAGHTRIATRWMTDPQGALRLLARFADVPGTYSKVMREGFGAIERYAAERRAGPQADAPVRLE